jgi:hypothetical protein
MVILLININIIESKKDADEIKYSNKADLKNKIQQETKKRNKQTQNELSFSERKKLLDEEPKLQRDVLRSELNHGADSKEKASALHKLGRNMYQQGKYNVSL